MPRLIWIASAPRSGNTLLRHSIERMYCLKTWSVYDDFENADILPGKRRWPFSAVGFDQPVHFVKTHDGPGLLPFSGHNGITNLAGARNVGTPILIVRDFRDAMVSFARMRAAVHGNNFRDFLEKYIRKPYWSSLCQEWISIGAKVFRYEDMIDDPATYARNAVIDVAKAKNTHETGDLPLTFADMNKIAPVFCSRGTPGAWLDEFPADLIELFWENHGEMMIELGYANTSAAAMPEAGLS